MKEEHGDPFEDPKRLSRIPPDLCKLFPGNHVMFY